MPIPSAEKWPAPDQSHPTPQTSSTHQARGDGTNGYLHGFKFLFVFSALMLTVFLVNLDQTIVATALPRIVSDFNALDLSTWIVTAYFSTDAGFMLAISQLLDFAPVKWVYLSAISLFEVGSVICGVAPSINVLIFGRAIAGLGAAGITICAIATIAQFTPLEKRPVLFALFGADLAIASIVGPLLDHVSWRWCFYINLPFGAIAAGAIFIWLPYRKGTALEEGTGNHLQRLARALDWIGTILCLGLTTTLLLALQWGGTTSPWSSPTIIVLFAVFGVLLALFIVWEAYLGHRALLPFKIIYRPTQIGSCLEAFWLLLCLIVAIYYLPLWYQINGRTAVQSGIDILPFMLAYVIAAGAASGVASVTGRYWHMLFASPFLTAIGGGLWFSTDPWTPSAKLIGYQIILGIGVGASFQTTYVAIQADWADDPEKTTYASGVLTFISFFGGILGIGMAGAIFNNRLGVELATRVPDLPQNLSAMVKESVTAIDTLPEEFRSQVVHAALTALSPVFLIVVASAILASIFSLMIGNHNIKTRAITGGAVLG
ncbi:hypothetical protein PLICRDRAFT_179806 [Plicaturopsis crispa FD-325 SS-3]|uniref:Major facilitator superfamily (MFS) profile domain-containing protein n=1 Tax=Plicaturopsis crispa FD-325 SS-3 TaxID=944288 RepID=A0A0C9T7F7_PLICR|nr:hypothetical protein PLICRDRAFT_179806 [Plicaturopsis crispa FD-325 SS-3]